MNKSQLFSEYNHQKAQAIHAGAPKAIVARINRGLGVAQLKEERPYHTTETSCTCPDFVYRKITCKHIQALRLKNKAERRERADKREAEILHELGF